MDLGATAWTTFWRVTLPLIAPGVLAAGLLAFALSIDDFVITYFNAGTTTTFPLFVWGSARVAAGRSAAGCGRRAGGSGCAWPNRTSDSTSSSGCSHALCQGNMARV